MIRILVVHRVIHHAGDVDGRAIGGRHLRHRQQREEAAVAETPHAQPVAVDVGKRLQVIRGERRVAKILAADVHVHRFAPCGPVSDAAAVVGREHDVALLQQVLMEGIVDRVVPLHVPAVVVLVHAVAVNPQDGRMLSCLVESLRHEQIRRHLLPVRRGVSHQLRLDERVPIDPGRHRVRQSDGRRFVSCGRVDEVQVCRVLRIGVLIHHALGIRRRHRQDVRPAAACQHCDLSLRRVAADRHGGEMSHARLLDLADRVKNAGAVR